MLRIHPRHAISIAALVTATLTSPSHAQTVRISQIYGGGGTASSLYIQDYVELFNPTAAPIDLSGWTLQHAGITDPYSTNKNVPLAGFIPAGGYYLISLPGGSGGLANIPAPDATSPPPQPFTDNSLSAAGGKVALVRNNVLIVTDPCVWPLTDPDIADFVGYGVAASCREGGGGATDNAPPTSATLAILRRAGGCVDSDVNAADFAAEFPNPRNSIITSPACFPTGELQISMAAADNPVDLAQSHAITIRIHNVGNGDALNVSLSVSLPSNVEVVSTTPSPTSQSATLLTYSIGFAVEPGASIPFQLQLRPTHAGYFPITANLASPDDTVFENNTRTLTLGVFDPTHANLLVGAAVATTAIETPYLIDTSSGVARRFTTTPLNITALAADDANRCFWAAVNSGIRLYRIPYDSPRTPVEVASFSVNGGGATQGINGLAMLNGVLYASDTQEASSSAEGVYSVNTTTGATTEVFRFGTQNALVDIEGFEADPDTGTFLALNDDADGIPTGTGRGIYRFSPTGTPTKLDDYIDFAGTQSATDIDGLALGSHKLYLVPDEIGRIGVYDLLTASFLDTLPAPWQTTLTASAAAFSTMINQPPCLADFNGSGSVTVQDIFDFLAAYFTSLPAADINNSGSVTVQDIFDFLSLYFIGC